jgi:hypothetical protein
MIALKLECVFIGNVPSDLGDMLNIAAKLRVPVAADVGGLRVFAYPSDTYGDLYQAYQIAKQRGWIAASTQRMKKPDETR